MSYLLMPKSNVVSSCEIVSKMFSRAEQNQHLYIFELHPTLHYCTDFFFSFFCWKDFQNTNDFHRAEKTLIKTQTKICISIKYLKVFIIGLSLFFFFIKLISESTQLTVLILLLPWKSCLYLVLSMTEIVEHALKKFPRLTAIQNRI